MAEKRQNKWLLQKTVLPLFSSNVENEVSFHRKSPGSVSKFSLHFSKVETALLCIDNTAIPFLKISKD